MTKQVLYLGLDPSHYQTDGHITHCPLIRIIPRPSTHEIIEKTLQSFKHYTHVIITSKSAIPILAQYLPLFNYTLQDWANKITLAVGQVTANRLRAYGINPQFIAEEETAEGLIVKLKDQSLEKAFIFWPHSALSRPTILDFCLQNHIKIANCVFYDTFPLAPLILPSLEQFDEIIFTSPSTVEAFLIIFKEFPLNKTLTPIGRVTANYLKNKLN